MPFTAHDLRYHIEQSFPVLYAYLQQRARRYLGPLKFDAFEMDLVVEHVIEQLVRLGILGSGDHVPENALDRLSPAQFYAFLNHSIRNKSIDRLRKHRLPVSTFAELEAPEMQKARMIPSMMWSNLSGGSLLLHRKKPRLKRPRGRNYAHYSNIASRHSALLHTSSRQFYKNWKTWEPRNCSQIYAKCLLNRTH